MAMTGREAIPMQGLMQDHPLLVTMFLQHGARHHGGREVVSVTAEGIHRYRYRDCERRARQLASALERYGIRHGDRVATLAWNSYRHLEAWYAISGSGAITHTVNPRLFKEQITYIINHAEDRLIFSEASFLPILEEIWPQLKTVEAVVVLCDRPHLPNSSLPKTIAYEDFLQSGDENYSWPVLDERSATGLCYTSGTTGHPKGVLYSHRALVLHSYAAMVPDVFGLRATDSMLAVVPMFHANAWGVPYMAVAAGAKLVMPGADLTGPSLHRLIMQEEVTVSAGVPTVWLGLLNHLKETGADLGSLRRVIIGGSAAPRSMIQTFEDEYGVTVGHAWGMTEMSPLGTFNSPTAKTLKLDRDKQLDMAGKQGRAVVGIDLKITDDDGRELPWDGKTSGHLKVRGHWVVARYFKNEGGDTLDEDGWFDTGDVAHMDDQGFMQITDRAKDIIKSGGEWISSIDLENAAVAHPDVLEAAVIGIPHSKWGERPLLIIVPRAGATVTAADMIGFLEQRVAKWWLPDDVVCVEEIPHTATGKIQKVALRSQFKDYVLPSERAAE